VSRAHLVFISLFTHWHFAADEVADIEKFNDEHLPVLLNLILYTIDRACYVSADIFHL
jgi:hypothetical protein